MSEKHEENLQIAVCQYLKMQYPKVLFTSDASGVRLTMGQAVKMKRMRSCPGWPDLFIAEPRGDYHGLFIELKKQGERLLKKDASPVSDHVNDQLQMQRLLSAKGYASFFGIGFDQTKRIIDSYLSINNDSK
jgi:hypothetical protein